MAGPPAPLRLALAQVNARVGDLEGNAAKVVDYLERARAAGAELVLFPELVVTGYPPEDLLLKEHFLRDARAALDEVARETRDVVALAWARLQRAGTATDPALRTFAEHWLGRGYAEARGPGCPAPG